MRIGSLFSGIGGIELGLEWSGLGHTVWQVERDEFCRSVLASHWPDALRIDDVHHAGAATLPPVDLICGGFPCQDVSGAGKGAGLTGERSSLWFEFARVVAELRPEWVVVENVTSGAGRWLDAVCAGLAQLGYQAFPVPLAARDVGAPHRRARIFVVARTAHPNRYELRAEQGGGVKARSRPPLTRVANEERIGGTADPESERPQAKWTEAPPAQRQSGGDPGDADSRASDPDRLRRLEQAWRLAGERGWPEHRRWRERLLTGVDDGIPRGLVGARRKALGNAVVPQCAEVIGWVIRELGGY